MNASAEESNSEQVELDASSDDSDEELINEDNNKAESLEVQSLL